MTDAKAAREREAAFLAGVEVRLEAARGSTLRGTIWETSRHDETDALRAMLAARRIFDRDKLRSLPANRRLVLRGYEKRFLWGRRPTGVAVASVLSPMDHYAHTEEEPGPPIDLPELTAHLERIVKEPKVPHLVGICSPTGFTESARNARFDRKNLTVVLIEPDDADGWRVFAPGGGSDADPQVLALFDPEDRAEKIARVRRRIEQMGAELSTGGISASVLQRSTGLPAAVVKEAFERTAAENPELRLTKQDGELLLYRGAPQPHRERKGMNVVDRIKQLFSREGDEAAKINLLAERRAALAQRRDRLYEDIARLEKKEAELRAEGKAAHAAGAEVKKRRLAAQLVQLRKDISRQNAAAAMLNKQIDIISTDIHNLTLIQQGQLAQLPDTQELTENAVKAEEMLERLQADADLVGNLETGIEATLASDEEQAILREFEEEAAPTAQDVATTKPEQPSTPPAPVRPESQVAAEESPPPAEGESKHEKRSADADAEPT